MEGLGNVGGLSTVEDLGNVGCLSTVQDLVNVSGRPSDVEHLADEEDDLSEANDLP